MILAAIPFLLSFFLKYKYRQINYIFILLLSIGVMQGLCDNISLVIGSETINWGAIKAVLVVIAFLTTLANIDNLKKKLPITVIIWFSAFIMLFIVIVWHIVEAISNGFSINSFNVIQNYSLLNMLMVIVTYFNYKEQLADMIVEMLVDIGKYVSVLAILQWIAIKYYENSLLLIIAARRFGDLDVDGNRVVRVFSVFSSHYGLSAFLMIVTILYVSRSLYGASSINYIVLSLLGAAHLMTFNITGVILTIIGCYFAYFTNAYTRGLSLLRVVNTIKITALVIACSFMVLALFSDFRQRLYDIFNYSENSTGVGYSLYLRNQFLRTKMELLSSNLNGIGLTLNDISRNDEGFLGYVRVSNTGEFSSDAWFPWLILQIGIFWGLLLLFIYIYPFLIGLMKIKTPGISSRWHICAFTSLLFVILFGSFSNSPVLTYPPSNILVWCAIGGILAIHKQSAVAT